MTTFNNKLSSNRVVFIDNLKCFAIICVIFGHSLQYTYNGYLDDLKSFNLIYSFHMPLFMMLSGYFAQSSLTLNARDFFKKKSIQLLLPALTWSVVKILLSGGSNIFSNLIGSFWFLKSVFLCYSITYIVFKIIKYEKIAAAILFLTPFVVFINFYTYMLNYMLPCFVFGIMLRKNINYALEHRTEAGIISLMLFIVLLPLWTFSEYYYTNVWDNGIFSIKNEIIYIHRLVLGLSGSLFLFIIFSNFTKTTNLIKTIGASTLGLYVMNAIFCDIQRHVLPCTISSEILCIAASIFFITFQLAVFIPTIILLKKNRATSVFFLGITR